MSTLAQLIERAMETNYEVYAECKDQDDLETEAIETLICSMNTGNIIRAITTQLSKDDLEELYYHLKDHFDLGD